MKKIFFSALGCFIIFCQLVLSQPLNSRIPQEKNKSPYQNGFFYSVKSKTTTPYFILDNSDETEIRNYLLKNIKGLNTTASGLKLVFSKNSPGGKHYTYQQMFLGLPVYGATVKVNTDNRNRIVSILDASLPSNCINENTIKTQLTGLNQRKLISSFILKHFDAEVLFDYEKYICFTDSNQAIAVQHISVWNRAKGLHVINLLDVNGNLIFQKDLNVYFYPVAQDSLINVKVFNPDPLTVAGVSYGSPYTDNGDADAIIFDTVRFDTTVIATYDNGLFTLQNDFVSVQDFELPATPVVSQTNPDFYFTRSNDGFENVNAFYHITCMQDYVQSLGFNNLMNQVLEIDTHGANGADNSFFSGAGPQPSISMGEGGVDDAEDADVIIHEYGHALSWSANSNNFVSSERAALDEAFGDYQAASYSRSINPFHWHQIFTWDGHNPFWSGRFANTTKIYPQDITGSIHDDGEIWSSVMMEIWGLIGKTTTDKLHYESLYGWSDNMTMPDAALLIIQADSALNGGINYSTLCDRFKARGLYNGNCTVSVSEPESPSHKPVVLNSSGFASGQSDLIIVFDGFEKKIHVRLTDLLGRTITSFSLYETNRIFLSPAELPAGMFVVEMTTGKEKFSSKVLRIK